MTCQLVGFLVVQLAFSTLSFGADLKSTVAQTGEMAQFVPDKALQILRPLEAQARQAAPGIKVEYLTQLSTALRGAGERKQALAISDEVITLGQLSKDQVIVVKGLLEKAYNVSSTGDLAGSHRLARQAEQIAETTNDLPLRIQATISSGQASAEDGDFPVAITKLQKAAELARPSPEAVPKLMALNALARMYGQTKAFDRGFAVLDEAYEIAADAKSPARMAMLKTTEYGLAMDTNQPGRALAALEIALKLQQQIGARRAQAVTLVNLSDSYLKAEQFNKAIQYGNAALHAARSLRDHRLEATALANLGQAQIATGLVVEGKRNFELGLADYEKAGDLPELQVALKEYGRALERAGDPTGAIAAYHRERSLSEKIFEDQRAKAIWDLQEKYETAAKERSIELLQRDNTIQAAEIRNRELESRIGYLLGVVIALAGTVVCFMYRKVRKANARLKITNQELEYKSTHDPLTGLYNRRYLQEYIASLSAQPQSDNIKSGGDVSGAIFIVDIDHFKKINDSLGHASGDAVLVEIAQRLRRTFRGTDVIVRWGGEEFVVYLSAANTIRIDEVAQRLLNEIGSTPVVFHDTSISVTASVGYAPMCLTSGLATMGWEDAVSLVDKALYLAKADGRNRAYGIYGQPALTNQANRITEVLKQFNGRSEPSLFLTKTFHGPALTH